MNVAIVVLGMGIVTGAAAIAQTPTTTGARPPTASANLIDTQGRNVGQARLQQAPHGVLLELNVENVTPGVHALHIHEVGQCDPPSFESAGDHVNPSNRRHGFLHDRGPHAGDLPNIEVPASGPLSVEFFVTDVALDPGPMSLLDSDGSAIVIHSDKDDYSTDPSGESGDRVACGPIVQKGAGE